MTSCACMWVFVMSFAFNVCIVRGGRTGCHRHALLYIARLSWKYCVLSSPQGVAYFCILTTGVLGTPEYVLVLLLFLLLEDAAELSWPRNKLSEESAAGHTLYTLHAPANASWYSCTWGSTWQKGLGWQSKSTLKSIWKGAIRLRLRRRCTHSLQCNCLHTSTHNTRGRVSDSLLGSTLHSWQDKIQPTCLGIAPEYTPYSVDNFVAISYHFASKRGNGKI